MGTKRWEAAKKPRYGIRVWTTSARNGILNVGNKLQIRPNSNLFNPDTPQIGHKSDLFAPDTSNPEIFTPDTP
jgi:hypothetical protein